MRADDLDAGPEVAQRPPGSAADDGLKGGQLGFPEILFQAIASASPGIGVTLAVVVGASFAGGALSLSLVLAIVGVLLVGTCIGQLAARFPSAGGFYTFVANGLHPAVGAMVAWLYLSIWIVFPSTLFLPFGGFLASTLHSEAGFPFRGTWIVCALLCVLAVWLLARGGASLSTRIGVILGSIEFLVVGVLAVTLIVSAGSDNTLSVFTTTHADVAGFAGASGVVGGMIYAIYAFVGFENAVPMAEEARDPRRAVTRVAVITPLILGVFIIFCTYAATVYFGVDRFDQFPASNGGDAWFGLAKDVWHSGWYLLLATVLNSCVAGANAATNAATRHLYAMGRIQLLPRAFTRTDERTGAPRFAIDVLMAGSIVVTLVTGLVLDGGPLQAFGFLGTIETGTAILLYLLVALSCLVYFLRVRGRERVNPLLHVVVPVLAIVVMVPALMAAVGIGSGIFSFITPLSSPFDVAGYIALGWLVLGVVYAAVMWTRHPDRVRATEEVFVEGA